MRYRTNDRLIVFGQTGSGKTYFIRNGLLPRIERCIIYDSQFDYTQSGKPVHTIEALKNTLTKTKKIVYQPKKHSVKEFNEVCKIIFNYIRNVVFVVDELHLFAPNNNVPSYLKQIITTGRKMGIGFIGISQRPQLVDKTFITQAQHVLIFKVFQKDLDYLEAFVGNTLKELRLKQQYSFAYMNYEGGTLEFENPI